MGIDYTALATEITTHPENLGYAPLVKAGRDADVAALLNAASGPGTGNVATDPIPRDTLLLALAPACLSLSGLDSDLQAKWDRILSVLQSASQFEVADATVQGLLAAAMTDGVLTSQEQAAFPATRTGTRAEVLFGSGTVVNHTDFAIALGR